MTFITYIHGIVLGLNAQELIKERERLENANKLAGEHPGQEVPINIGGEKLKVIANGYGKEIKPA
jgi:hypothetical protein